jgi:hypothetical protein
MKLRQLKHKRLHSQEQAIFARPWVRFTHYAFCYRNVGKHARRKPS